MYNIIIIMGWCCVKLLPDLTSTAVQPGLRIGEQQDAHEFYSYFIDKVLEMSSR